MRNFDKRTLWVGFLESPTEEEIQEAANKMKNGKAYLFINKAGQYEMNNKRFPYKFTNEELNSKFVRKVNPTK